jgi:hypothetical protein
VRAPFALGAFAALLAIAAAAPTRWSIDDPGQGPLALPAGGSGARQLSGITWAEGTRFYAVSDKLAKLYPLSIAIDPQSGAITHAAIEPGVPLPGSTDAEGIAYDPAEGTVWISDEFGPAIREYRLNGSIVRRLSLPPVYLSARKNLALESLALDAEHALWTANEETLTVDGERSSPAAGSTVRLQRFDRQYQPAGQWAYVTDPTSGDFAWRSGDSGVSDLVALPGGALVALERAFGPDGLRIRLYEIDRTGATDISSLSSLAHARFTPVHKRLLWERRFHDLNFEGAALGPELANGARSLVLVSDDGHHLRQSLYALTLRSAGGR